MDLKWPTVSTVPLLLSSCQRVNVHYYYNIIGFQVKSLDQGNAIVAKQTLVRLKMAMKAKGRGATLEQQLQPYIDEALPQGQQRLVNIRSLKVFLMVVAARGLSAYEVENLVGYLDRDSDGFVGVIDLDKEITSA